jgi:Sporulation and spore germination
MKNLFFLSFTALLLISCGSNKADEPIVEEDSLTAINYAWQASLNDSTGKLEMKKAEAAGLDSLSTASIIDYINRSDSSIHLDIVKTSNDTVYLKIPDATYLTQRMGSTGSEMYLASVVYNLTELPGIRFINFDFEEGDHAQPGILSRNSFNDQ